MNCEKYYDMIITSFPTQEDIKLVLNDSSAIVYEDIRIESFTTEDVLADKKNYAGGMVKIKNYFNSRHKIMD